MTFEFTGTLYRYGCDRDAKKFEAFALGLSLHTAVKLPPWNKQRWILSEQVRN